MRARVRLAGGLTCAFVLVGFAVNLAFAPDRVPERILGLSLQGAIGLAVLLAASVPGAARHATSLAIGLVVALSATLFYALTLSPGDVDVLSAPVISLLIGSAVIFPWGAAAQSVVSVVTVSGFVAFIVPHLPADGMRAVNLVWAVAIAAAVSLICAAVLEGSRRSSFAERRVVRALALQRRRLIDLGHELRASLSVDDLCQLVVAYARRLLASDAILFLYDAGRGAYTVVAASDPRVVERLRDQQWTRAEVRRFGEHAALAAIQEWDAEALRRVLPVQPQEASRRALLATIGSRPDPAGFLVWTRFADEPFTKDHRLAAEGVADQAFTALKAAQLHAELREEGETLEIVHRIGAMLSAELDLKRLVQGVTDAGTQLSGAEFGAFFYQAADPNDQSYSLYTLSGAPAEAFAKFPMPRATALFGPTFRGEGAIRIDDVRKDPRFGKSAPHHGMPPGHLPVTSYLSAPVKSRSGEVVGGLFFGHHRAGVFTERAERIVVGLAAQTAIAMDNARLYDAERRARAEAESASRAKDEFLATLSHELRTPLNLILGFTEMAADPSTDARERSELIHRVEGASRQLLNMIEDTLEVGRVNADRSEVTLEEIGLPALWREIRAAAAGFPCHAGVRVHWTAEPPEVLFRTDRRKLQVVMRNLVGNALKFTMQGFVRCEVCVEGRHAVFRVADSGIGIPQQDQGKILEMFSQADGSDSRSFGGTGLGLYIVRRFAEQLGGTVSVESEVGRGSTFTLRVPLASDATTAPAPVHLVGRAA
ncbi:MAG: GAF domain-containing protein [Deltaproteobacteria bacterium]|nr:GAF domain-containing protein [Deltaproteobacteria bacterium]